MHLSLQDIEKTDIRYRTNLINSLAGYKQPVLIGTRSSSGHENLAIFNSLIHIGANPALNAVIVRPHTVERHTLENILDTGHYTLNYPSTSQYSKAHHTAAKYDREVSEFEAAGFTPEYTERTETPFVKEAPVKMLMHFEQRVDIPINGTIMIIGSIQSVFLHDNMLQDDGFIALEKGDVLSVVGLDAYYSASFIARLPYAKPH